MRKCFRLIARCAAGLAGLALTVTAPVTAAPLLMPQAVIRIAGGEHGIGFDDIGYFPSLGTISIPAGQTGNLVLLDPASGKIAATYRITTPAISMYGREQGTSSATYGDGYIFASDHGQPGVVVLDARDGKRIAHVKLASGPDYVRYRVITARAMGDRIPRSTDPSASYPDFFIECAAAAQASRRRSLR
ncbi:MAG: PH domain-containing protein [Gammaproteobacteria bacterium]